MVSRVNTPRKPVRRAGARRSRKRAPAPPATPPPAETDSASPLDTFYGEPPSEAEVAEPQVVEEPLPTSTPEPSFAVRVAPPAAPRPLPSTRRAIFFDVENSSKPDHVARILRHLQIDRLGQATELVGVGNWRVISHETARMLAQQGAHLVHSAPSVGVRDWSDLRIAVSAGVWLAGARPGDSVEIISDDQAFDAVGDVAASLGVVFRRLSYRALAGILGEVAVEEPAATESRSRRRRRGGRGGRGRRAPGATRREVPPHRSSAEQAAAPNGIGEENGEAHTAPHDELLAVARDLIDAAADRTTTLDALSNALKEHGFRRTPGSPRLITRLRRIRQLEVTRNGTIRLVASEEPEGVAEGSSEAAYGEPPEPSSDADSEAAASDAEPKAPRRRRRRGGRRRRGRGNVAAAAAVP
jgi:hypothetical protein